VRGPTKAPTAGNPDYRPAPLTVAGRTRADQASISVLLAYRGRIRGGPLLHRGRAPWPQPSPRRHTSVAQHRGRAP